MVHSFFTFWCCASSLLIEKNLGAKSLYPSLSPPTTHKDIKRRINEKKKPHKLYKEFSFHRRRLVVIHLSTSLSLLRVKRKLRKEGKKSFICRDKNIKNTTHHNNFNKTFPPPPNDAETFSQTRKSSSSSIKNVHLSDSSKKSLPTFFQDTFPKRAHQQSPPQCSFGHLTATYLRHQSLQSKVIATALPLASTRSYYQYQVCIYPHLPLSMFHKESALATVDFVWRESTSIL